MTDEETIKIKKGDLWKYATFILVIALIVVLFFAFGNKGSQNGNATNNGNTGQTGDVSVFLNNPSLYPSIGPENAKHTVVEFSDFQCPFCTLASGIPSWTAQYGAQYADLVGIAGNVQELAASSGDVRFIYVPMSFLGQESVWAAEAAYCANEQGKFWEMHDAIFAASTGPTENDGKYTKDKLKVIASKISGLDTSKFNSCLDSDQYASSVQKAASDASKVASGTPTFYVDGQKVSASWTTISALIEA